MMLQLFIGYFFPHSLTKIVDNIVGDILISAGCIAYLGPFTGEYRANMCNSWVESLIELKVGAILDQIVELILYYKYLLQQLVIICCI